VKLPDEENTPNVIKSLVFPWAGLAFKILILLAAL
jgi:hypothetical protein